MNRSPLILVTAILLAATACRFPGKSQAVKTPPAPVAVPAASAKPAPASPEPLSTPQTDVQLPPPQPVSPEALATIQPPPEPAPEPPVPPPAKPVRKQTAAKPEPVAPAQEPPAAAAPPAEEPIRLGTVLTDEQRRRIAADLDRRKAEITTFLRQVNPRRSSAHQKNMMENVRSLLKVAEDAAKRGDMTSADSLSERALILARELANER
jgi:hypothetical protein